MMLSKCASVRVGFGFGPSRVVRHLLPVSAIDRNRLEIMFNKTEEDAKKEAREAFEKAFPPLHGKVTDDKVIDALLFVHANCDPRWISTERQRTMMRNTIVRLIDQNELGEDVEELLMAYMEQKKAI